MFSDEDLLNLRIKERHVYADERSKEKDHDTGVVKRKYKLFCSRLRDLDIYLFFVSDGAWVHCILDLMVWVAENDWEWRDPQYLNGVSYFDLRKTDSLSGEEVVKKMRDVDNCFLNVAILPISKYRELQELMRKNMNNPHRFGSRKNKIPAIIEGLLKEEVSQDLLVKLGLN